MHADRTERLCKALAAKITAAVGQVEHRRLAGGWRHHPGLRDRPGIWRASVYVEREGGDFKLRRGFHLERGCAW